MFYQTRSNAIILQGTLPANCIVRAERLKTGEKLYETPKISLKHDLNWTKGNDQVSTVEHRPVGKLIQQSLGETLQSGSSKPTQSPKPIEDRTGQPVTQEIVGKSQGELSSSDRSGKPDREEEKRVLKSHDRTGLQQIENHLQREALQSDLQQHRAFNPFSKESEDAIMAAGNTELCEIIDVEPKSQCRAFLTHWSAGIVYCTCGHFMKDDTTENKKYISSVLDLFSIPNFYIRKGRPHGHRYGKAPGCKEYHTDNQLQKRCRKKIYENFHDRFIRDTWFRKTMIELGRSEEIILEMDRLASEDHSHIATKEEIDVYRGNWWIRSNEVNFDTMPTRHQPDFKKALSTMYRLKKAEDEKQSENWSQSSSSWWPWQTNWWEPYYENSPQRWSDH